MQLPADSPPPPVLSYTALRHAVWDNLDRALANGYDFRGVAYSVDYIIDDLRSYAANLATYLSIELRPHVISWKLHFKVIPK